ncbi:hypothetical protein LVD15_15800 [Fulvivirga maritima]|uniref:baeRF7 domain-containing protein n=1 Tax=Fulvivirga maritima TaxID=2904247 RepID=UPI001F1780C8|nr:hypothetical protein [Fulvivirga maritima]UII24774.1 hypothetical protein LVD15_15800 [Fulvivirga maritima]
MDIFKRSTFLKLSEIHQPHCVSIYIPTERAGGEEGRYKNKTKLKNQLKEAANQLKVFGLSKTEIDEYLQPAQQLLDDERNFWSEQSDALALFIYGNEIEYFTLPLEVQEYTYVSNHLYLQPLANMLHGSGRHFIMMLSLNEVKFYEATRHTLTPVVVEGLIPQALEETVGGDYEENSLQFRSGQGEQGQAMYHGHGSGNETEKKEEAAKFFKEVNDGLMEMLHDEDAPLVVACVDYLFPIYMEANTYSNLCPNFIQGNHEHTEPIKLKEMAWDLVKERFEKDQQKGVDRYNELLDDGKASYNPEQAIPAAIIGQADTLFIQKGQHVWGTYQQDDNKVKINATHQVGNADLLNKAAAETIKHGGKVYELEADQMPDAGSLINAVLRYKM